MLTIKAWLCLLTLHNLTLGNKFGVLGLHVLSFGIVDFSIDGISIFFVLWTKKDAASKRSTAKASTACNCQGSISSVLQSTPAAPIGCFAWVAKKGQRGWKKTNEFHGRSRVFTVFGLIHVPGGLELVAGAGAGAATATAVDSFSSLIVLGLFSIWVDNASQGVFVRGNERFCHAQIRKKWKRSITWEFLQSRVVQ